ncbi:MAG: hypothetical protein R6U57_10625 [Anaerolineales bacterium]
MANLRECTARLTRPDKGTTEEVEALFHQWGKEAKYDKEGNMIEISVGILELKENGQVVTVEPGDIIFTDK